MGFFCAGVGVLSKGQSWLGFFKGYIELGGVGLFFYKLDFKECLEVVCLVRFYSVFGIFSWILRMVVIVCFYFFSFFWQSSFWGQQEQRVEYVGQSFEGTQFVFFQYFKEAGLQVEFLFQDGS